MQGYLKLCRVSVTDSSTKLWEKFFCRRDSDRLVYQADEYDPTPLGFVDLGLMTSAALSKKDEKIFKISTQIQDFEFWADTPLIANQWVKALREWKASHASILLEEVEEFKVTLQKKEEDDKHVCRNYCIIIGTYHLWPGFGRIFGGVRKAKTDCQGTVLSKTEGQRTSRSSKTTTR